jgi:hypothetical protein
MLDFRRLVRGAANMNNQRDAVTSGSGFLSLLRMRHQNVQKRGYVTIEDNFLQAGLHVHLMRMAEYVNGAVPDYPDDLESLKLR